MLHEVGLSEKAEQKRPVRLPLTVDSQRLVPTTCTVGHVMTPPCSVHRPRPVGDAVCLAG
jgi:hypothetical protein